MLLKKEAAPSVLLFEASVGFAMAWVIVVTDPAPSVEVKIVVTTKGALVTICPWALVVVTYMVVFAVTVVTGITGDGLLVVVVEKEEGDAGVVLV